ncbi:hypothetical protein BU14_0107s0009 [Porphyra umbilicalis]|uniref:Uncharacterized protein n=1 Tax=Porphyra umbilicalis TaxID=2786 RepID=A0A1X6PCN4_PORUM|nr:hypothetical protein BU14_0107s0009 [Porphyra umbilicalis]|eukprot:OSX78500.1 hypothetical protein BU14_0107s0009 [Porphyra umbilicalis]
MGGDGRSGHGRAGVPTGGCGRMCGGRSAAGGPSASPGGRCRGQAFPLLLSPLPPAVGLQRTLGTAQGGGRVGRRPCVGAPACLLRMPQDGGSGGGGVPAAGSLLSRDNSSPPGRRRPPARAHRQPWGWCRWPLARRGAGRACGATTTLDTRHCHRRRRRCRRRR